MAKLKTKRALAAAFGCSYKTVLEWAARVDFPGGNKGPWDRAAVASYLEEIQSPYAAGREAQRKTTGRSAGPEAGKASALKLAADALTAQERHRKLKLENDRFEGQLVYVDHVLQSWAIGMHRIRTRLEALPEELESLLPDDVRGRVAKDIDEFVRQLQTEMGNWEPIEL